MEETPFKQARTKKQKGRMHQGYYWPLYGDHDEIVFTYSDSRARHVIEQLLDDQFSGTMLSDGYKADASYVAKTDDVTHVHCWMYIQFKFFEARNSEPDKVDDVLERIGVIYEHDKSILREYVVYAHAHGSLPVDAITHLQGLDIEAAYITSSSQPPAWRLLLLNPGVVEHPAGTHPWLLPDRRTLDFSGSFLTQVHFPDGGQLTLFYRRALYQYAGSPDKQPVKADRSERRARADCPWVNAQAPASAEALARPGFPDLSRMSFRDLLRCSYQATAVRCRTA